MEQNRMGAPKLFCSPSCRGKNRFDKNREKLLGACKEYREKNKTLIASRARKLRRKNKQRVMGIIGNECAKCGRKYPQCVFDLHHKDSSLKTVRSGIFLIYSWEFIEKEIPNLELVCANCHRILHNKETAE